jgi:hypothetical protein
MPTPPPLTLASCRLGDIVRKWDGAVVEIVEMNFSRVRVQSLDGGDQRDVANGTEVIKVLGHTNKVTRANTNETQRKK